MKLSDLANPRILEQPTYQPGKPIEVVAEQYGFKLEEVCKLASNENPWGASPQILQRFWMWNVHHAQSVNPWGASTIRKTMGGKKVEKGGFSIAEAASCKEAEKHT